MSPCKVCRRHVRPTDGKCPFCGTLAAAALAIGLAFFAACGGKTTTPAGTGPGNDVAETADARPDDAPDADINRVEPIYGVPAGN